MIDATTGKPYAWDFVNATGERQSISPDCGLTLNDAPSLVAAALNGYGIVRLLDFVAKELILKGELVEVMPEWKHFYWPAFIYTSVDEYKSPASRLLSSLRCRA